MVANATAQTKPRKEASKSHWPGGCPPCCRCPSTRRRISGKLDWWRPASWRRSLWSAAGSAVKLSRGAKAQADFAVPPDTRSAARLHRRFAKRSELRLQGAEGSTRRPQRALTCQWANMCFGRDADAHETARLHPTLVHFAGSLRSALRAGESRLHRAWRQADLAQRRRSSRPHRHPRTGQAD